MNEPLSLTVTEPADRSGGELLRFERLLADLSARFVNLPAAEIDRAITDALRSIVELLGVDRSQLIRFTGRGDEAAVTHSWAIAGVPIVPRRVLSHRFPWAMRQLRAGGVVVVPRVADLPPEASVDKATWTDSGVRSNLTVPMRVGESIEGVVAFGCLRNERTWPAHLVERVSVLVTVLANALAHKRAQEALDAAIDFERITSDVLAALLTAPRAE